MLGISDNIEKSILEILNKNGGKARIIRNELAVRMNCVPSQINYVLRTRFTDSKGYYIESRRGGNGGILITKYSVDSVPDHLKNVLDNLDKRLTETRCISLLNDLAEKKLLTKREAKLLASSYSDKALSGLSADDKCETRYRMLSRAITYLITLYGQR